MPNLSFLVRASSAVALPALIFVAALTMPRFVAAAPEPCFRSVSVNTCFNLPPIIPEGESCYCWVSMNSCLQGRSSPSGVKEMSATTNKGKCQYRIGKKHDEMCICGTEDPSSAEVECQPAAGSSCP